MKRFPPMECLRVVVELPVRFGGDWVTEGLLRWAVESLLAGDLERRLMRHFPERDEEDVDGVVRPQLGKLEVRRWSAVKGGITRAIREGRE
jgi:hypothetical protein